MRITALIITLLILATAGAYAASHPWGVVVIGDRSEQEQLATADLQRYIAQVTGAVPEIMDAEEWKKKPVPAIVIGTPSSNPVLSESAIPATGDQGYYLANKNIDKADCIVAAGSTPFGAVNAVYGLLWELGYGFYLGSESVPPKLPDSLPCGSVLRKPEFKVRGVLPWYNFFNSPTTWDPVDHRAFIDQLIRQGANFVGFHTYHHEPFAAYEENGRMIRGGRLLNTSSPTWGTSSMKTSEFAFGTSKLFANEYFGAATTFIPDADAAIRAEQDIMRDALDYAKRRGLYTCLGFEMIGDPYDPETREIFLNHLNRVLNQYPSLDFIWLWQSETVGATGFSDCWNGSVKPDSPLPNYAWARRDYFDRVVNAAKGEPGFFKDTTQGKADRAAEGARLEQFARTAYRAISRRENPPRLVISGWGGDERLLAAEYFDGLDKLLPRDVIFSALDHIVPRERVDRAYGELPSERERWPIPWLEFDGDQWQPQPYVHTYEKMMRDADRTGSQGILGIHWRTREIEENFGYMMRYAWTPNLTADAFFEDYARRCYSAEIAGDMAKIHSELDKLGYRWVGGGGQGECAMFSWGPGGDEGAAAVRSIRDRVEKLLPRSKWSRPRVEWMLNYMDWVLSYREASVDAVKARDIMTRATNVNQAEAKKLAGEALELLDSGHLATAIRAYAAKVSTRGEYGVLATVNTKAVADWRNIRAEALRLLKEQKPEPGTDWLPTPRIIMPRMVTSGEAGKSLALEPVVFGGGKAWIHYRNLEASETASSWTSEPLKNKNGWVKSATIPGDKIKTPGIEIGFSFNGDPAKAMAYGPIAVTVMPPTAVNTSPRPVKSDSSKGNISLSAQNGRIVPIELNWNNRSEADFFRVWRDGKVAAETAVSYFPDISPAASGVYGVEAIKDGKVLSASAPLNYVKPKRIVGEKPELEVKHGPMGVFIDWPAATSPIATHYKLSVTCGDKTTELARMLASTTGRHMYYHSYGASMDKPCKISVTAMSVDGLQGIPGEVVIEPRAVEMPKPSLYLPLTSKPEGALVTGNVEFTPNGARFSDGFITLPHAGYMGLGDGLTVEFEFKADDVSTMPVVLSHGLWMADGWFAQILGNQFLIRTAKDDARGLSVATGQWYKLKFVFDGSRFHLWVNDLYLEQNPGPINVADAPRKLVIGSYDINEPQFQFKGTVRNVRIYDVPVM